MYSNNYFQHFIAICKRKIFFLNDRDEKFNFNFFKWENYLFAIEGKNCINIREIWIFFHQILIFDVGKKFQYLDLNAWNALKSSKFLLLLILTNSNFFFQQLKSLNFVISFPFGVKLWWFPLPTKWNNCWNFSFV